MGIEVNISSFRFLKFLLREKYQGVKAPDGVQEAVYDPVASPSVVQQLSPATQHFVEYVAQFQILKALCNSNEAHLVRFWALLLLSRFWFFTLTFLTFFIWIFLKNCILMPRQV